MYQKFYGFSEYPFSMTPNSKFFFKSLKHTEALSTMVYAIEERKGFVVITGDVGAGKTTVCRTLLNKMNSRTRTALITNTYINAKEMLTLVLEELCVPYEPGSKIRLLAQLNQYLIEQLRDNYNVVLIIDEAQNLTLSILEEIRMLSNLETESEKLLQIIFLGQPELKEKLSLPCLRQLRQRIAVYYHLSPLSEEETRAYIRYRVHVASGSEKNFFSLPAMHLIYTFSSGVPRLINQICDSALLSGFIYEKKFIDEDLMREVINESPMAMIKETPEQTPMEVKPDFLDGIDSV